MYTYHICIHVSIYILEASRVSFKVSWEWWVYRNVIRMRWDCGKNPILISVHLTGIPPYWPTALTLFKKCGGTKWFIGQVPLQEYDTFTKNISCRFLRNIHARGVLWESFVFLEGDLTCEPFRSHCIFWRGSMRWANAVGFLSVNHWLE